MFANAYRRLSLSHVCGWFCPLVTLALLCSGVRADEKMLLPVERKGKKTIMHEKVVVISDSATLYKTANAEKGDPIEGYAIFFKLAPREGENGRFRVGDDNGEEKGWIDKKHVRNWNTRYVLEPKTPDGGKSVFKVETPEGVAPLGDQLPDGIRRFAFVYDTPDAEKGPDTSYPVRVFTGQVYGEGQAGTLERERNTVRDLNDLKLEIVFVIESTDFMHWKFGDKTLFDHLKGVIREAVATVRAEPKLKGKVRFGFVEYQDTVPKAKFTKRLSCDLTDDFDTFLKKLDEVQPILLDDDWPDDVLAGMNEAIVAPKWSENSVKHVILLGMASCQLIGEKDSVNQLGAMPGNSLMTYPKERDRGFNSTGLSIERLVARAWPQGSVEHKARLGRHLHAFLLGKPIDANVSDEAKRLGNQFATMRDEEIEGFFKAKLNADMKREELRVLVSTALKYRLVSYQRALARSQYQTFAKNHGEADGLFREVEPDEQSVKRAATEFTAQLKESFAVLKKAIEGEQVTPNPNNRLAKPIYQLTEAMRARQKKEGVSFIEGAATVVDEARQDVAAKKVMVSKREMQRLHSRLLSLYDSMKDLKDPAKRGDTAAFIKKLKFAVANSVTGQEFSEDDNLGEILEGLPMKSDVLNLTARTLRVMKPEQFEDWLKRLKGAIGRAEDLLDKPNNWRELNRKAQNSKYTFLLVSELP